MAEEDTTEARTATVQWPDEVVSAATPLHRLGGALMGAASEAEGDAADTLSVLARVAYYHLVPSRVSDPYQPMVVLADGRSPIPDDLSDEQVERLRQIAPEIPHPLLRARTHDVVSLQSAGRLKMEAAQQSLEAVVEHLDGSSDFLEDRETILRAVGIARQFGRPMETLLESIELHLLGILSDETQESLAVAAADLLAQARLGTREAESIAARLATLAEKAPENTEEERGFREGAAEWFRICGRNELASAQDAQVVRSLLSDSADTAAANGARALYLCETALGTLRRIPRNARAGHGLEDAEDAIRRQITAHTMGVIQGMRGHMLDSPDLGDWVRQTQDTLRGLAPIDALLRFVGMVPLSNYEDALDDAQKQVAEHPFTSLFPVRHLSADGRTTKITQPGGTEKDYGVDTHTWRQMVTTFNIRTGLHVNAHIVPGLHILIREHNFDRRDMERLARNSPLVPQHHTTQFATGLAHGFSFDFLSASQILSPQVEHLVRFHLKQMDHATTTIDESGIETEVGLAALAKRPEFVTLLGPDLAFELRALMCDPMGHNLRNDIAHGLQSDDQAQSHPGVYLWWLALRLAISGYQQALAASRTKAQESVPPSDDADTPSEEATDE